MEESRKKPIMIGVVIVCIALAVIITLANRKKDYSVDSISDTKLIWVKCRDCEEAYQTKLKDYLKYIQEHGVLGAPGAPPLICEKCGAEAVYEAVKCNKCGFIFEVGSVPNALRDTCPKCGYSETEEKRQRVLEERGRK